MKKNELPLLEQQPSGLNEINDLINSLHDARQAEPTREKRNVIKARMNQLMKDYNEQIGWVAFLQVGTFVPDKK